ncbi:MAG: tRNA (adenosine(37)-N6)-threonylcarbamoyltransferase complex transferase subunit TsaD [Anaerorhabdus sp.]|uniref:tRNA (adenosine(37)-N6)-threonylcarbamoyltransferase complex transferase subunit TsaD n=1 Tax=Anaerorhabdus sp. TaxID=1872524 RepID=UPI003A8C840B
MTQVILAIESSCDETACSIVRNGNEILSNIVSSQINVHKKFGGVVPEVASRIHVENISVVIAEAMEQAKVTMDDIDAIAFTQGPGLIGSLHVGVQAAKTLAWMYNKPLIPLHHIIGHIYANGFVDELTFPLLALVVSGGHTELVFMKDEWSFDILGTTQDDAIGEAYDKVARVLGLPYPGGPAIDKLAKEGNKHYGLPTPKTEKELDFSFSGLKSAVLQLIQREEKKGEEINKADLAYCFQETALDTLVGKTCKAVELMQPKQVVLAGGVAANSRLREKMIEAMAKYSDVHLTIPPLWCCTDNAAMIGAAGNTAFKHKFFGSLDCSANPCKEMNI